MANGLADARSPEPYLVPFVVGLELQKGLYKQDSVGYVAVYISPISQEKGAFEAESKTLVPDLDLNSSNLGLRR